MYEAASVYGVLKKWKPVWRPTTPWVNDANAKAVRPIEGVRSGSVPRVELRVDGDAALFLRPDGQTLDEILEDWFRRAFIGAIVVCGVLLVGVIASSADSSVRFESCLHLFLAALMAISVLMRAPTSRVAEDEEIAVTRTRGGKLPESSASLRKTPIHVIEGTDVAGVQLCECPLDATGTGSVPSGQMNLMLAAPWGSRVHLVTHDNLWIMRRDARRMAEFLDKPIFDHLPKPS